MESKNRRGKTHLREDEHVSAVGDSDDGLALNPEEEGGEGPGRLETPLLEGSSGGQGGMVHLPGGVIQPPDSCRCHISREWRTVMELTGQLCLRRGAGGGDRVVLASHAPWACSGYPL